MLKFKSTFCCCLKNKVQGYFSRIMNKDMVKYSVQELTINFMDRFEA
jgi:hypothetical protein